MSEIVVLLSSGTFAAGLFGYLRYRNYTKFLRHVVDKLGVDGLKAADRIAQPSRAVQGIPMPRQMGAVGAARGAGQPDHLPDEDAGQPVLADLFGRVPLGVEE